MKRRIKLFFFPVLSIIFLVGWFFLWISEKEGEKKRNAKNVDIEQTQ